MHNVGQNGCRELHGEDDKQQEAELEEKKMKCVWQDDRGPSRESSAMWFTHDVDQHGALLNSPGASRDGHNHQADGDDHHERCRREEVIVHEDAEIVENRGDGGADGHQEEGGEL